MDKITSIRILLSLAAKNDLKMHRMDVKTAFLNGSLDEDIYMAQRDGFSDVANSDHNGHFTGPKQSPRMWIKTINESILGLEFKKCGSDR